MSSLDFRPITAFFVNLISYLKSKTDLFKQQFLMRLGLIIKKKTIFGEILRMQQRGIISGLYSGPRNSLLIEKNCGNICLDFFAFKWPPSKIVLIIVAVMLGLIVSSECGVVTPI